MIDSSTFFVTTAARHTRKRTTLAKIGLYSVTYRGVWYKGEAINVFDLLPFAKEQGWEGWGGRLPRLIPKERMDAFNPPPETIPKSIGHHLEWIEACKGNGTPRSNFAFAGPLTESVLLGTVAVRTRRTLQWDSKNLRVTNLPEANTLITKPYRKSWELGKLG